MARNGKIARLPRVVREALNRRLEDGEPGPALLDWLNALLEAKAVLAREFAGRPVSAQNLSEWRHGGFAEWPRHQDARGWVRSLSEQAGELAEEADGVPLADQLAGPVAVALGRRLGDLMAAESLGPEERRELLGLARELAQLRRGDHTAARLQLEREAWEMKLAAARAEERTKQALKEALAMPIGGLPLELRECLDVARNLEGWPGGRQTGSGTTWSAGREAFSR
jgi:hypothetical protein